MTRRRTTIRPSTLAILIAVGCLSLLAFGGCGFFYGLAGYPPEVTRKTPPEGIDERSKATAVAAPPIRAPATRPNDGGHWVLQPNQLAVVIFYRGHW